MIVGLGTGSTVAFLLPALAARSLHLRCVATSPRTEEAGRRLGLTVEAFDHIDRLDMTIDGADQVAPDGWLVKGGGAAHTREKIVAAAADRFVVIADSSKPVAHLHPPIPLELLSFGLPATLRHLAVASFARRAAQPRRRRDRRLRGRGRRPRRAGRATVGHPGRGGAWPVPAAAGRDGARRPGHDGGTDGFPALSRPRRHRILRCRPRRRRRARVMPRPVPAPLGCWCHPPAAARPDPTCRPR